MENESLLMSNNDYGGVEQFVPQWMDKIIERLPRGSRLYSNGVIIALAVYVVNTVSGKTPQAEVFRWGAAVAGTASFLVLLVREIMDMLQKKKTRRRLPSKS